MNSPQLAKSPPQPKRPVPVALASTGKPLLQRKCACGGMPGVDGECSKCREKRLQRKAMFGASSAPLAGQGRGSKRAAGTESRLTVNDPGDAYEREADKVAQSMMGGFSHPGTPPSRRQTESRQPAAHELTQGGERLSAHVAQFYESRFGRDFSGVRVHTGKTAQQYNNAVNAYAFTYGNHVWLGDGLRPQPSHILAHELAHVVQQMQPAAVSGGPVQTGLSASRPMVRRFAPYWMPKSFNVVGTETHELVLPVIGQGNKIFTEAPVPNANKRGGAPGFEVASGIADLYQASSTVGLYFKEQKIPKKLRSNKDLKFQGVRYEHAINSAPQADEQRRSVIHAAKAPTDIKVGDLKPSHGTIEALEGPDQVQGYLAGFRIAREAVNELSMGTGSYEQTDAKWPELKTGIIAINIPSRFREPAAQNQDARPLKLMHNGRRVDVHREVLGKVYVREDPNGGGIWNYTWEPTTPVTTGDLPASVTNLGSEITAKIIRPLLVSPVGTAKMAKPVSTPALTRSPVRIQARENDAAEEVKDPFDKDAFAKWNADHDLLTGEKKQLEKTPAFKETEFRALVAEDRKAALKSKFELGPAAPESQDPSKTLGKISLWTRLGSSVFGKLRYWFGGAFVKVVNVYHSVRARFHKVLEGKAEPKSGSLLSTVIKIAFKILKIAGRLLIGRAAQYLVDSLKTGVAEKLKSLIPEEQLEEFEAKVQQIEAIASDLEQRVLQSVEDLVKRILGPYEEHIQTIVKIAEQVGAINDVIDKVRWGAKLLACLSPPGWGCLWILAQSVIERFASFIIDKCWFKRAIAPLVTKVDFIAQLPKKLAAFIVDKIKEYLPGFGDLFAQIDTSGIATSASAQEVCGEDDSPNLADRFLVEKEALAELRKEIGDAKWDAWTELAKRYGINPAEPLSEAQVTQLKKELLRASVGAIQEAIDLYPALIPANDVTPVHLTAFLEQAQQTKREMNGEGEGRDSGNGDGGIDVSASQKGGAGNFKPTKLGFKVVSGVTRTQHAGDIIKVNRQAVINGQVVTLHDLEVLVKGRRFIPNERNPEQIKFDLQVTRDQYFEIEKELGAEVVNRIGYKRFNMKKGVNFVYTLPVK